MYPLTHWTHEALLDRLDRLIEADFHHEAVIGSAQVLEQGIKRVLRSYMVEHRLYVPPKCHTRHDGATNQHIMTCLRKRGATVKKLGELWEIVVVPDGPPQLRELFGQPVWDALIASGPVQVPIKSVREQHPYGLMKLRHFLVHGTASPPRRTVERLSLFGREAVQATLAESVWTSEGLRSPYRRMFAYRQRRTDP